MQKIEEFSLCKAHLAPARLINEFSILQWEWELLEIDWLSS